MAIASSYLTRNFAPNQVNTEIIRQINIDGPDAYRLKGNTDGVSVNSQTFDEGKQDQFLQSRTAHAKECRASYEKAQQEKLKAAALAGGFPLR